MAASFPEFSGKLPGESVPESAFQEEKVNFQEGRLCHKVQQIQQGRVPQKGEQEVQALQQRDTQKEKMS